mgnify:CR=1 FL=1
MNTCIDFYILDDGIDRLTFACQLIEKAYKQKHRLFIQCGNEKETHRMDNQLWLFKTSSFVPHNIQGEGPTPPPPIQLGYSDKAPGFNDILINLSLEVPPFHRQFKRVIEIVDANPEIKEALRKHYRFYQSQSYSIQNHNIR